MGRKNQTAMEHVTRFEDFIALCQRCTAYPTAEHALGPKTVEITDLLNTATVQREALGSPFHPIYIYRVVLPEDAQARIEYILAEVGV